MAIDLILPAQAQIVVFWGEDYRAFYNDAYAPAIGVKHPHALGEPAHRHWGELWDDVGPLLDRVRATGETFHVRDRPFQIDRYGYMEEVFFDISYSAIRDEAGGVAGILCIVSETTERVRALQHLELAQTAGAAGIFEWYPDDGAIRVSDGYRRLYGFAPGAAVTSSVLLERIHPDDRAVSAQQRLMSGAEPEAYVEYRIHRVDTGEERWLSRRGELVRPPGASARFTGVVIDITDRKRAELAAIKLNETLEAQVAERTRERDRIWRNARDLMVVVGVDGVVRAANPAWTAILGFAPEEVIGRPLTHFLHEAGETPLSDELVANAGDGQVQRRYRHKHGLARWISWRTVPEGDVIYAYGRDITEEREAAEALARTEAQLRQAQKMEAVGQLTGGIAHDFNNLLQGITGSLDLIKSRLAQGRTGDLDRFIAAAMSSAERTASLTHRLLAFSRRQPLDPRPLDVNPLISAMEPWLRRTIGETITLELALEPNLWMNLCDAHQLESAILNLVLNARDAMPDGGRLTVESANVDLSDPLEAAERDVRPGQYVRISVCDTGIGMTPEVISRAFEPFFTTKPLGQGTGLGLSMIYGFARQSEGAVKLVSEPGRGTTAKLYLPRFEGPVSTVEPVFTRPPLGGDDEVVLVVEDEPVVRDLIIEVLGGLGYRTLDASTGGEGLAILNSDARIDLVVTDIGLPGMNGRMMIESARAARADLRVLFMTGYAENAAAAAGFLGAGMQLITKPFTMDSLARRVEEMLGKG